MPVTFSEITQYLLAWYLLVSGWTYAIYLQDKAAAQSARWRTRETTLHFWSLMGGWPGAWLAQKFVRHKSRKPSFQIVFRITVAINCAALLWIASQVHKM